MSNLLFYIVMQMLIFNEGFEAQPYQDTKGFWTIGYGYNLSVRMPNPPCKDYKCLLWTKADAFHQLNRDVIQINNRLSVRYSCYKRLPVKGKIVMIDLVYNMGIESLFEFKNFMISMCVKNYSKAGDDLIDSDYYEDVPARALRNIKILIEGYKL